jgi:hypothetical protein
MNSQELLEEINDKFNELSHKNYDKNSFKAGYLLARFKDNKEVLEMFWNDGMMSDNGHFGSFENFYSSFENGT